MYKVLVGKPEGKRPLGNQGVGEKMESELILWRLALECGLDSTGSLQGPMAGCSEFGDESSGSCATELVSYKSSKFIAGNPKLFQGHQHVRGHPCYIRGLWNNFGSACPNCSKFSEKIFFRSHGNFKR
jgi:hypothetical protein